MPENELVPMDGMPTLPVSEKEFKEIVGGDYLPRLQVVDSSSKVCKKDLAKAGNYALIRAEDDVVDLTNQIDVLVVHMRFTALDFSDGDAPVFNHVRDSAEFKRIEEESKVRDSGCMWGPEFLLYVDSVKAFATYLCSSATSRRESKNIIKLVRKAATFKTHYIEKGKYSWHGPLIIPCSTAFDIPDPEEIKAQAMKFANVASTEAAEAAPESERER